MSKFRTCAAILTACGLATLVAYAQPKDDGKNKNAQPPEMQLPAGWTEADMQACIEAGTPGAMHEKMLEGVGTWEGQCTMWMAPDAPPMTSSCTATVTSMMDGRYIKNEMKGDMPGMGPFNGFGIGGYDNVSKQFVSTWVDNHSTGIMYGTGKLSADGKKLEWTFKYNCPVTKKQTTMREVETFTSPTTKTMEMWGTDPKTGKEFKMMRIEFTKQA